MIKRIWKRCYEFRRLMEILNDYWLTVPDEKFVKVELTFEKANGEKQHKVITWINPKYRNQDPELKLVSLADIE